MPACVDSVSAVSNTKGHLHSLVQHRQGFSFLLLLPTSGMRTCLVFICSLAATFSLSVNSNPHGKHHELHKTSHTAKEKDIITVEANEPQLLPTLVTFEASSQEQEDEELSYQDNANANKEKGEFEVTERSDKTTAVLLSEEELVNLLKKEAEEEQEAEARVLEEEEAETDKIILESGEAVETIEDEEEDNLHDKQEMREDNKDVTDEEEKEIEDESVGDAEMLEKEEGKMESMSRKEKDKKSEQGDLPEETDGSTESEIPVDLDHAADSGILQPLQIVSAKLKPHTDDTQLSSKTDVKEKETGEKGLPTIDDVYTQDVQNTEAVSDQDEDLKSKDVNEKEPVPNVEPGEPKTNTTFELRSQLAEKEEEKNKNDSEGHMKRKTRKQKKNKRARKHSPQSEGTQSGQEESQQDPKASDSSIGNTAQKAKRRRAGKWGPLVGMNPVQIRATVDLYPSSRPSLSGGMHHPEAPADPCDDFPCKRGKTCKLDADNKPGCVCQEPSECPPSVNEFDHVCGTNNKTYDTSCELFATKCNLEGTKRGHRLHLDYTGPCKLIPPCVDTELVQFPLRMRDWLKNVLLQLYEHDSMSPGFLTPKQRFRVKKIFESDRRLHAGDHSVELLAQDFEKNYNMYIYPVHWQFAQLDQHPSDRVLSHSELAPLRVPLVPMEHCTSRFFRECDADKDKQVSFKEWTSCFGINTDDMDVNLLF
ncbi:SPARC-like protein 1 isoform X1 [Etheostoma spectabile]|uniref:SPARC-like protein 1 isoform X1 n=2 Tax=Etheostoma spectabile TaxID=54343 RepID=UPI0013AFD3C3|nr:SPARC-like protein 1 isoform X1 [Etheostoma spectabile]